jgi:hypothetical protein
MPGVIPEATGQPAGGGQIDPFGMMNSLMGLRLKMNENQQFQTQYQANQAVGEIIAHAPSLEEGLNQVEQNPMAMGFGGQAVQTARTIQMLKMQTGQIAQSMAATKLAMGKSGLEGVMSAGLMASQDPANWNKYFDAGMSGIDPSTADYVKPKVDAVKQAIAAKIQGLNMSDPAQLEQARKAITSLVAGGAATAGVDSSHIEPFLPKVVTDTSGVQVQQASPLDQAQGRGSRLLTPPAGTAALAAPPAGSNVVVNSATKEPMDATANITPWVQTDPNTKQPIVDMHGNMLLKPGFMDADEVAKKDHAGPGLEKYNMAGNLISSTSQTDQAVISLAKRGGLTVPGFMGDVRGTIANALETIQNLTGKKFSTDAPDGSKGALDDLPEADASVQQINKWQHVSSFQMKNMLESTGGRGLGVLMEAAGAVPGMNNTPLGFLVLNSGIRALADWETGKYEFKNAYMKNPAGTLMGSDEAYMRQHPPVDLAQKELAKFGMSIKSGELAFNSKDELDQAKIEGLLGPDGSDTETAAYIHFYKTIPKK